MDQIPFKHRHCQLARIQKFLCHDRFDGLCLTSKLYPRKAAVHSIAHAQAADDTVTFAQAVNLSYDNVQVGQAFGPLWSKHWFRLTIKIPESWSGQEVRLVWNSGSECQVWVEGKPLQGLSCMKKRYYYTITPCVDVRALDHTIYIEMSVNGIFNDFNEAPPDFKATLTTAEIRVFDRSVFNVSMDLQVLYEMAKDLPSDSCMSEYALRAANDVINAFVLGTKESYEMARSHASHVLALENGAASHHIHAVGYANIDSAWLWPYRKTPMKSVSSWSTAFSLMEKYPFKMAFTQPQQLQWVREKYPDFYNRVKYFINTGQLLPVGATWIEMDANLPNGECLLRQFLYGQKFLQDEFGMRCTDLWLLDSFGYSAQLPQIMKHCDVTRFVTIKLSWNCVNKFPHNTFWWEGLGGHRVLAHFPPGTNYHKEVTVEEACITKVTYSNNNRASILFPEATQVIASRARVFRIREVKFKSLPVRTRECWDWSKVKKTVHEYRLSSSLGWGEEDTVCSPVSTLVELGENNMVQFEEMLEKLQRMNNLNGLPGIQLSTPEVFYESVERDPTRLCTWVGELYLERHQGTYTSQAQVKKRNRRAEFLLREMDFWTSIAVVASTKGDYRHPGNEMHRIWKLLMLNQFHDVLPGTCHPEVYKDFHAHHDEIERVAGSLCQTALTYVLKSLDSRRQKQVHLYSGVNGCVRTEDKTSNGDSHLRGLNGCVLTEDETSNGDSHLGGLNSCVHTEDKTSNGDSHLRGLNGCVLTEDETSNGDSHLGGLNGCVLTEDKTSNGDSHLGGLNGCVHTEDKTSNGDSHLGGLNGCVHTEDKTSNGDSHLGGLNGCVHTDDKKNSNGDSHLEGLNGCVLTEDKTSNGDSHLGETNGLSQAYNGSPESPEIQKPNGTTPAYGGIAIVNSLSWSRKEVVKVPAACSTGNSLQTDHNGNSLGLVQAPGCGLCSLSLCEVTRPVTATLGKDGLIHLRNHLVSATVDNHGRLVNLWTPESGKNYLKGCHHGNQLVMYDDFPLYRDAWDTLDFNLQTRRVVNDVVKPATVVENGPVRVVVEVCLRVSESSHVTQSIILDTESPYIKFHTQVSWHECHKFLKVEFPTSMTSSHATYEIQFGHLQRPTHYNTSWDSAKYEVCGHKWADISEHGRGVALLNDCKYGYSCVGGTLRLSLLRSPTAPDTKCDIGNHVFTYAVMPYAGIFQDAGVIQEAYNLNSPLIQHPSLVLTLPTDGISYFQLDTNQVVLETVKVAEEDPQSLILRLYESFGGSVAATLSTLLPIWSVSRCNGLEEMLDDDEDVQFIPGHPATIRMSLDPFQILSLIARF